MNLLITVLMLLCLQSFSQAQDSLKHEKGVLVYYGDSFIFIPETRLRKKLSCTLKNSEKGFLLKNICFPEDSTFTSGFREYGVNNDKIQNSALRVVYAAECTIEFHENNRQRLFESLEFDLFQDEIALSIGVNSFIAGVSILDKSNKSIKFNNNMWHELQSVSPDTFILCDSSR